MDFVIIRLPFGNSLVGIISLFVGGASCVVNTLFLSLLAKCILRILTISNALAPLSIRDGGIGLFSTTRVATAKSDSCNESLAKINGLLPLKLSMSGLAPLFNNFCNKCLFSVSIAK